MDHDSKINAFWQKCDENRKVSVLAQDNGYFNAAASRYYYAFLFAFNALFIKKGMPAPEDIHRKEGLRKNPYPGTWPKPEIHEQAGKVVHYPKMNITKYLYRVSKLRVKGDYAEIPVEIDELNKIRKTGDEIFKEIENEIGKL